MNIEAFSFPRPSFSFFAIIKCHLKIHLFKVHPKTNDIKYCVKYFLIIRVLQSNDVKFVSCLFTLVLQLTFHSYLLNFCVKATK